MFLLTEVSKEDNCEREDDRKGHHLLRVDHLLPHGGDHVKPNEPIESRGRPTDDPINSIRTESSLSTPDVMVGLTSTHSQLLPRR